MLRIASFVVLGLVATVELAAVGDPLEHGWDQLEIRLLLYSGFLAISKGSGLRKAGQPLGTSVGKALPYWIGLVVAGAVWLVATSALHPWASLQPALVANAWLVLFADVLVAIALAAYLPRAHDHLNVPVFLVTAALIAVLVALGSGDGGWYVLAVTLGVAAVAARIVWSRRHGIPAGSTVRGG